MGLETEDREKIIEESLASDLKRYGKERIEIGKEFSFEGNSGRWVLTQEEADRARQNQREVRLLRPGYPGRASKLETQEFGNLLGNQSRIANALLNTLGLNTVEVRTRFSHTFFYDYQLPTSLRGKNTVFLEGADGHAITLNDVSFDETSPIATELKKMTVGQYKQMRDLLNGAAPEGKTPESFWQYRGELSESEYTKVMKHGPTGAELAVATERLGKTDNNVTVMAAKLIGVLKDDDRTEDEMWLFAEANTLAEAKK